MPQMARMYETTNRKLRAAAHRRDARECALAGYPGVAEVNAQMADLLDPPPPPEKELEPRRGSHRRPAPQVTPVVSTERPAAKLPPIVTAAYAAELAKKRDRVVRANVRQAIPVVGRIA